MFLRIVPYVRMGFSWRKISRPVSWQKMLKWTMLGLPQLVISSKEFSTSDTSLFQLSSTNFRENFEMRVASTVIRIVMIVFHRQYIIDMQDEQCNIMTVHNLRAC